MVIQYRKLFPLFGMVTHVYYVLFGMLCFILGHAVGEQLPEVCLCVPDVAKKQENKLLNSSNIEEVWNTHYVLLQLYLSIIYMLSRMYSGVRAYTLYLHNDPQQDWCTIGIFHLWWKCVVCLGGRKQDMYQRCRKKHRVWPGNRICATWWYKEMKPGQSRGKPVQYKLG